MFKLLAQAYNQMVTGLYYANIIAINPKEWEWLHKAYLPYEQARIVVTDFKYDLDIDKCPEWALYKGSLLIFKPSVPVGEIWMWRLKPNLIFKSWLMVGDSKLLEGQNWLFKIMQDGEVFGVPSFLNTV